MANYIPKNHVKRLFPYSFFNDLDQTLPEMVVMNPVFLAKGTKQEARMQKNIEQRFEKGRDTIYPTKVEHNNIHSFEQGTFLILHPYVKREDHKKALKGKIVRRWMLLAQWYDLNEEPLFDLDTPIEQVADMSTIDLNDDRLALAFMETVQNIATKQVNNTLHVIKGPKSWLNTIEGPWEQLQLTTEQSSVDESKEA